MNQRRLPVTDRKSNARSGLTLVEILIATSIATVVMAGVMYATISIARLSAKNERIYQLASSAREIQELITQELSAAINIFDENIDVINRPVFSGGDGKTPQSYRQITYRSPVGPPGKLLNNVSKAASSVTFFAPGALKPQVGDFFVLDTPKLGRGIKITSIDDGRASGASGNVTVTLETSLAAGTARDHSIEDASINSRVEIQRSRSFVVDTPASGATTTTFRWIENDAAPPGKILSEEIAADQIHLFKQIPEEATARETSIGWYLVLKDRRNSQGIPGNSVFFSSSSVGGSTAASSTSLIMPKSGNSLVLSNPFAAVSTSLSTTSTSTSTSTTTSKSTTTTSKSTTTQTTSKSTTSKSTTKTTSKSTTKTSSKSTTSQSTTKSTSQSTTSQSTTKSTSQSTTSSKTTTKTTVPFDG